MKNILLHYACNMVPKNNNLQTQIELNIGLLIRRNASCGFIVLG